MEATKEEKTVQLLLSYYTYIFKVKLNMDWQIRILSKSICIVDGITFIAALYLLNNFWAGKKYMCLLAKKVGPLIRNISLEELDI